jgi:16S rRNA processing protein RimM
VLAGEIGKPHGIVGEVYVLPLSDDARIFEPGARLAHADGRALVVAGSRGHRGDRLLVKFEGIDSRTAAERLRGVVYAPDEQPRELELDEYWPRDLVGCAVHDPQGRRLGGVEAVVPGQAQDLLAVVTKSGSRLVPLVKAIVTKVDLEARTIIVNAPPGLLDE